LFHTKLKAFKTMENQIKKGYKVTDENMNCRSFQYELNKVYTHKGSIEICERGFHYCPIAADCFGYYSFDSKNRVFEIIDHGTPIIDGDKHCTYKIELIRELSWIEVLGIVNSGKDNTGLKNSGNSNSGNWNSGYRNSGNWNSGNWNSGNWNSGNWNSGDSNSGYRNSGDRNSGNWNSGDSNSGNSNSGNWNSGNWNSGDSNSGDSNSGYRNSGAFCTDNDPKVLLFDKEVKGMTVRQWENHAAYNIMANCLNPNIWIYSSDMTDEEKAKFPTHETTGGYLKRISMHEAWSNMWYNLTDKNKKIFLDLPNFDSKKFKEITGIDV